MGIIRIITSDINLRKLSDLIKTRIEILTEIPNLIDFFETLPEYSTELFIHKKMKTNEENSLEVLKDVINVLRQHEEWTIDALHELLINYAKKAGLKNGKVLWPIRTAVSGKAVSPGGAFEIMEILGKDESILRMEKGIQKLECVVLPPRNKREAIPLDAIRSTISLHYIPLKL